MTKKTPHRFSKRAIAERIALCGAYSDYYLQCSGFAGIDRINVNNASVGFALQRALRAEAERRPDLFPKETTS